MNSLLDKTLVAAKAMKDLYPDQTEDAKMPSPVIAVERYLTANARKVQTRVHISESGWKEFAPREKWVCKPSGAHLLTINAWEYAWETVLEDGTVVFFLSHEEELREVA